MARRSKRVREEEDGPFDELLWALQWMDEEERNDVIDRFCAVIHGPKPSKPEPVPKTPSAEDVFRARGMGIRLD